MVCCVIHSCKKPVIELMPPTLDDVTISEISTASSRLSCNISNSGNQDISDYGFVYSEINVSPTLSDSKTSHGVIDPVTPTPIAFTDIIQNLKPNTTYHVSAYTTIGSGPVFSKAITFKTSEIIQPKVKTDGSSNITINTARLQGSLEAKGTFDITEYGMVWSATNSNPTTADSKIARTDKVTSFPVSYTFEVGSLVVNTSYNYRAYVISNGITTYGNTLNFKTLAIVQPSIITGSASNLSINSANLQGTVSSKGTFDITEYGVVWSASNASPTTSDAKAGNAGNIATVPTTFTVNASNLSVNTTYNYRAFVISNGITTYGNTMSFRTLSVSLPSVSTDGSTNVGVNSARLLATVQSKGSYDLAEYGICYSSRNAVPTTTDSKSTNFGNPPSFPSGYGMDINGLSDNTTYYFRAYVISNGTITYGGVLTFKTSAVVLPTISTDGESNVSTVARNLSGTVISKGSYNISEYGMCWSFSNANPNTSDSRASISGNPTSFPARFTIQANGILYGKIYYYRAYVISNGVTVYGAVKVFSTGKD